MNAAAGKGYSMGNASTHGAVATSPVRAKTIRTTYRDTLVRNAKVALLVAVALLLIPFVDADAQTTSGSYTLYNSNGSPIQLGQNGTDSQSVNLSSLTQSLQGFNGFSSLQVNVALYGNNPATQVSDTYGGYSLSHDVYSTDGSVEYVYFTRNENISNSYGQSAAGVTVGNSSNSGYAPYYTTTSQTLSNSVTGSTSAPSGIYLINGTVCTDLNNCIGASPASNLCNVGDCYAVFEKNQYVTSSGYTGEYGVNDALALYDLAGVNATHSINYAINSSGSNEVLAVTLDYSYSPVPLPAAGWLMLAGLSGIGAFARKKRASTNLVLAA